MEAFRKLWSREGTLGGAAWRYAAMTQDYGFAVREMLRGTAGGSDSRPVDSVAAGN